MLNFSSAPKGGFCDRVSRRDVLKIGGLSFINLSLAQLFQAHAAQGTVPKDKKVIMVYLAGGASHIDTFDPKEYAPSEVRGDIGIISTKVPEIQVSEVFGGLASHMDDITIIRSLKGTVDTHDPYQVVTGWLKDALQAQGGYPSVGAVLSHMRGPIHPSVPPYIALSEKTGHIPWSQVSPAGMLGAQYGAFSPDGQGMRLNLPLERMNDRRSLLQSLDRMQDGLAASPKVTAMHQFNQQAFDVLTSTRMVDALDLSKEDPSVIAQFGTGAPFNYQEDGATTDNSKFLTALRLLEAGARFVTIPYGRWDAHSNNSVLIRDHGPKLDMGLSALIYHLKARGMLDDTLVVVVGEFGRSPKINHDGGRDHWPGANSALLIGGGLGRGMVIGATDRLGEKVIETEVSYQQFVAEIYRYVGIDPTSMIHTPDGRPVQLITNSTPIPGLRAA